MYRTLKFLSLILVGLLFLQSGGGAYAQVRDSIESRVSALMNKMTLEEKIGQMTQLTIKALSINDGRDRGKVDIRKLEEAIENYHVGSIFDVYDSAVTVRRAVRPVSEKEISTFYTRVVLC